MTVAGLAEKLGLNAVSLPDPDREISGAYIGDLLSWVMGKAKADNVWITIMSNINVVAVASLADVSCVLLAEGVTLDQEVLSAAKEKGINVLCSADTSYALALKLQGIVS